MPSARSVCCAWTSTETKYSTHFASLHIFCSKVVGRAGWASVNMLTISNRVFVPCSFLLSRPLEHCFSPCYLSIAHLSFVAAILFPRLLLSVLLFYSQRPPAQVSYVYENACSTPTRQQGRSTRCSATCRRPSQARIGQESCVTIQLGPNPREHE